MNPLPRAYYLALALLIGMGLSVRINWSDAAPGTAPAATQPAQARPATPGAQLDGQLADALARIAALESRAGTIPPPATRPAAKAPRPRVYGDIATAIFPVPPEWGEATRHLLYGQTVNRSSVYPIKFVYNTQYEKWLDDGIPVVINDERKEFSLGQPTLTDFIAACDRMTKILADAKAKCPNTPMTWSYMLPDAEAPRWGAEGLAAWQRMVDQFDFAFIWLGPQTDHANWRKNQTLLSDLAFKAAPHLPQVFHVDVVTQPGIQQLDDQLKACLEHPRSSGVIAWTAGGAPVKAYHPDYVKTIQKYAEQYNGDAIRVKGQTKK